MNSYCFVVLFCFLHDSVVPNVQLLLRQKVLSLIVLSTVYNKHNMFNVWHVKKNNCIFVRKL